MNETAQQEQEFQALLEFIKSSRGFDFTGYKPASLMRRMTKRLQETETQTFADYLDYLEVHPEEFATLFNTVLINVTAFFRDAEAWDCLTTEAIPQLIAAKPPDQPLRIWSAGCSSGEETYTLAIILAELLGMEQFQQRVKIYATDVDEDALARARQASYNVKDLETLPADLRDKYFEPVGGRHVFRNEPRRAVIFGRHDLIQDAPISRLDLLVCRNTLMYFNGETQSRILARFHFALNNTGLLFLGRAEMMLTIGRAEMMLTRTTMFTPMHLKHRIFTKVPHAGTRNHLAELVQIGNGGATDLQVDYNDLRETALSASPVALIVLDPLGTLVLVNEQAQRLFVLRPKDIGRPFRDLQLSFRPVELRSLIEQTSVSRVPLILREVEWAEPNKEKRYLDIQVVPLLDTGILVGTNISFADVTSSRHLREELQRASQELETAYEELQSTNEELETTNEELQSTVEELETTNEELQSTNEEMETMNEELQSTNEELETTNEELRQRTDELDLANAFLSSILASLRTGVVVVDRHLNIMNWNRRAEDLWGLRADEVQGHSFLNLDSGLPVEQFKGCLRVILGGESEYEEIKVNATTRRGKTIQCRVTCAPLRGAGKDVQGGILLMEEWEDTKGSEEQARG